MIDRRAAVREWFDAPTPVLPLKPILYGGGTAIVGLFFGSSLGVGTSLILVLLGVGFAAFRYWQYGNLRKDYLARPSFTQMTEWLAEEINVIRDASLAKCGLAPNQLISPSGVIVGPVYEDVKGLSRQATSRRRAVNDGYPAQYLYGCWEIHVLHFGPRHLMTYSCVYDWYSGSVADEETEGFDMDNVLSVRTGAATEGVDTYAGRDAGGVAFTLYMKEDHELELGTGGSLLQAANAVMLRNLVDHAVQAAHVARHKWASRPATPVMNLAHAVVVQQAPAAPTACTQCGVRLHGEERNCHYCGSPTGFAAGGHTSARR